MCSNEHSVFVGSWRSMY